MKKHLLYFSLLMCAVCVTPWRASAQAPDGEMKPNGLRVNSKEVVTIYGDFLGQPNPYARYSFDDIYYFKVHGEQVDACAVSPFRGKKFTKILIPGTAGGDQYSSASGTEFIKPHAQPAKDSVEKAKFKDAPICPDSFPVVSPGEIRVGPDQLGKTFWILTEVLADSVLINGKVQYKHADPEIFDLTYYRSRWFSAVMGVPFKYRFTKSKSSLTGESTIGASLGWTFHRDHNFNNRFWVMAAGGLTLINPNSAYDDPGSEKEKNIPGATFCLGAGANVGKTQAGIVLGWDFADPSWEYHGKPWVSFSVGFEFLKPQAKQDAVNK